MANLLEQLKTFTVVVADTGDFASIQKFRPRDATTNPSLIAAAAAMPQYQAVVANALAWAKSNAKDTSPQGITRRAVDRLAVEFGIEILKVVPGRVSTEVDARLSYDTQASIDKARDLIAMYEQAGIGAQDVSVAEVHDATAIGDALAIPGQDSEVPGDGFGRRAIGIKPLRLPGVPKRIEGSLFRTRQGARDGIEQREFLNPAACERIERHDVPDKAVP